MSEQTTVVRIMSNANSFSIDYPDEIANRSGSIGLVMPYRDFFNLVADSNESSDPKFAALLREVASHHPDVDGDHEIERDAKGNILCDFDDWDELTDQQKINRGNRYAAIAVLDRLRFDLEKASDEADDADRVTEIRRKLAALTFG